MNTFYDKATIARYAKDYRYKDKAARMKPSHQWIYATILWHIHRSKDRPKKRWSIHRKTRNIWIERIIKSSSQPGDLVDDPFLGSLPTAVIVEKLYRRRLRVEKSEEYVKLTRERLL